jgi:hypothetical protein
MKWAQDSPGSHLQAIAYELSTHGILNRDLKESGELLIIKVGMTDQDRFGTPSLREAILLAGKQAGYQRVTLDLTPL